MFLSLSSWRTKPLIWPYASMGWLRLGSVMPTPTSVIMTPTCLKIHTHWTLQIDWQVEDTPNIIKSQHNINECYLPYLNIVKCSVPKVPFTPVHDPATFQPHLHIINKCLLLHLILDTEVDSITSLRLRNVWLLLILSDIYSEFALNTQFLNVFYMELYMTEYSEVDSNGMHIRKMY